MMLTRNTAKAMDVVDRTDAKQSIIGGARYLRRMMGRFDDRVKDLDRLYLGLAAYNIGRGHMHDAQSLARQLNLNPYEWHDMKQVLPLLSQKKYYQNLKYGYARGTEPVRYVQRISLGFRSTGNSSKTRGAGHYCHGLVHAGSDRYSAL